MLLLLAVATATAQEGKDRRFFAAQASALNFPIVYTRVARTTGTHILELSDGSEIEVSTPDIWDKLPDTRHIFKGFNAPGQLVLLNPDGSERILFDCFENATPCVPLDPAVSLDGKTVVFSVYYGNNFRQAKWRGADLPNRYLGDAAEAKLYSVHLATGRLTPLAHNPGDFDISPSWLPDGRLMFASTRDGLLRPSLPRIGVGRKLNPQLFISDADGRNAVNVAPHEVASASHPYLLSSGRVAYGSQWLSHNLPYGYNNSGINWPATLDNLWVVMDVDPRGGDMHALLGAHRSAFRNGDGRSKTMKALHFLGERGNGDVCVSNYYRGNNLGLGDVLCWTPEAQGVEGELPRFLPRNLYSVANWSKSNDEASFRENGVFLGKVGYPEGLPNEQLLLTVGRGFCTQVGGSVRSFLAKALAEQPEALACDAGIHQTTQIPSLHMDDLQKVVDSPQWHEFGARVVRPRDVAEFPVTDTESGHCELSSSDAGSAETSPFRPYRFNRNFATAANNGGEIDGIPHSDLAGIRFWQLIPNSSAQKNIRSVVGSRLRLLGDIPLLGDKSFKVRLPCDTPFVMAGLDDQGLVIKRDQVPQSLRPSEKRLCTGCHLHSREGRPYSESLASITTAIPLLRSTPVPSYQGEIKAIFQRRCTSCHESDLPLTDYDALVWDFLQEAVPESRKIVVRESENPRRRFGLQRPYTSKYVNSMFARESLLYWKAANRRMDGRKDSTYDNDVDFGADHPVAISAGELALIALWLDSGAPL